MEDSGAPKEPCITLGPDPMGRGSFEGETGEPLQSIGASAVICAKTAEPIELPFGIWASMGPKHHDIVLDEGPHPPWKGAILVNRGGHCKV